MTEVFFESFAAGGMRERALGGHQSTPSFPPLSSLYLPMATAAFPFLPCPKELSPSLSHRCIESIFQVQSASGRTRGLDCSTQERHSRREKRKELSFGGVSFLFAPETVKRGGHIRIVSEDGGRFTRYTEEKKRVVFEIPGG